MIITHTTSIKLMTSNRIGARRTVTVEQLEKFLQALYQNGFDTKREVEINLDHLSATRATGDIE